MNHYRKSVNRSAAEQEYIYARSRLYGKIGPSNRAYIDALCVLVGGEYAAALREFVTTDRGATVICIDHHLSAATLYRLVAEYYTRFEIREKEKEEP